MLKGKEKNYRVRLLYEGFLKYANKDPDKIAVFENEKKITYGQLLEKSLGICRRLKEDGVNVGDRVVINLSRGSEQIAAILGTLFSGAVYVPVGFQQPEMRKKSIMEQAAAKVVISSSFGKVYGNISDIVSVFPENEAYIIFTSGSTGKPKGVRISHAAAMNTIDSVNEYFGVNENDTALLVSQVDFDLSVYDIFGLLSAGGSLVVLSDDTAKEPAVWKEKIQECGVTLWNSVPAFFEMLLNSFEKTDVFVSLKKVFLSGDWVPLDIHGRMKKMTPNAVLVAMGGATEASIWSNYYIVEKVEPDWTSIPYGVPLANQSFMIMDEAGSEITDGGTGELWIGGKGVAIGYTDNAITEQSFTEYNGEKWYHTGDYGKLNDNGEIIFCGRRDQQVKLHGFRIEMGEIEKVLLGYSGVGKAIAAVSDSKKLCCGIVPKFLSEAVSCEDEHPLKVLDETEAFQVRDIIANILNNLEYSDEYSELVKFYAEFVASGGTINGSENEFISELRKNIRLFKDILSGNASVYSIIEHEVLSPEKTAFADPETQSLIKNLCETIKKDFPTNMTVNMVLMGSQTGAFAKYILENIDNIHLDVIVNSRTFAVWTKEKLSDYENVSVIQIDKITDYSKLYAVYDVAVSIHNLHKYADEKTGAGLISFVLKENGMFYAIEQKMLRPSAYLTSMLIENGFLKHSLRRRKQKNPMLPANEWLDILKSCGIVGKVCEEDKNTFMLSGTNMNAIISAKKMITYASEHLPYYMIPGKVYIVPDWNYSDNGKVKKDFYIDNMTEEDKTEEENFEGVEAETAALFKEVLKIDRVSGKKSFFELGGDSLMLTRLLALIKERYQMEYSMKEAYNSPYIATFAKKIGSHITESEDYYLMEEGEI